MLCMGTCSSCRGCHEQKKPSVVTAGAGGPVVPGPAGYNLGAPKKFVLGEPLHEISGICFLHGNADTMYAIEDEKGRLYHFHPGDSRYRAYKFGSHGDYEDVTILGDAEFVVLRSDGSLFVFPVSSVGSNIKMVQSYVHILPKGEYEGLFGDAGGRLIALCKNCPDDDQREEVSGYVLQYRAGGHRLAIVDHFKVRVPAEKLHSIHTKIKFHPSCLARNPRTGEWYIISSVNKVLIVLDDQWAVKGMYDLDPVLFKQPEGLAFDKQGNMYISNEGVQGNANVLLFPYKP